MSERLKQVAAIDRSAKMIAATRKRNPDGELAERWLAPGGSVHVHYDSATSRRVSAER